MTPDPYKLTTGRKLALVLAFVVSAAAGVWWPLP